jgi:putative transposase
VEERLPLLPPLAHRDGTWEGLHEALRRRARVRLERNPQPSAAGIVDSQSVKTTGGVGGEERGFDAGKKVKGTLSAICLWPPRGWCSQGEDPRGERLRPRRCEGAASGDGRGAVRAPVSAVAGGRLQRQGQGLGGEGVELERGGRAFPEAVGGGAVGPRAPSTSSLHGALARRWVVERTFFCWLGQNRCMSKDYERLPEGSEAFVYVAMTRLMARRLVRT